MTDHPQLTREQELDLIRQWRDGNRRAGDTLYRYFLPFINKQAHRRGYMDFDDAVQIASIGFTRALMSFEEDRGCRFATHLKWAVRASYSDNRDPRYLKNRMEEVTIMDAPVNDDGATMADQLVEPSVPDYDRESVVRALVRELASLRPREKFVMVARMTGSTLETIGEHYGVSKERIRQIEAKALDTLRKRVPKGLKYYLEDEG